MADEKKITTKELELDGVKFTIDTDLIDDVEAFEYIDRIENDNQVAAVAPFLKFLVGDEGYEQLKIDFKAKDAEEHKDEPNYKPRFRASKLNGVYSTIIENYDPKG